MEGRSLLSRMIGAALALAAALAGAGPAAAQPIPDSIAAENVPAVPKELSEGLNRYQNIRLAAFEDWSPDGRGVLILTRFAETNQIHQVTAPLGVREQLTFLKERVSGAWSRPGRVQILYSTDEGGAENFQFFLLDLATRKATRVTDGRSRNVSPRWSRSGRWLAWSSNARNGRDMDLWIADPSDPAGARRVREVSGEWIVADWSPDDSTLAAVEYVSANESYVHLVEVSSGAVRDVTPRRGQGGEKIAYGNVRFAPDGASLYWTTDAGSEFHHLARHSLRMKTAKILTAGISWDVESFDLSSDAACSPSLSTKRASRSCICSTPRRTASCPRPTCRRPRSRGSPSARALRRSPSR